MSNWICVNSEWVFPLIVTVIFAIIETCITLQQKKLAEWDIAISLMEKRLEVFLAEKEVLQEIVEYTKPNANMISRLTDIDMEVRFLFGDEICQHWKEVMKVVNQSCEYEKTYIPDSRGGYLEDCHDSEEEEMSMQAAYLLGNALDLYKSYIDFSKIGIIKQKEKK